MNLVLDISHNGGLWLCAQYFRKRNSTLYLHFEQCGADGGVQRVLGSREKKKGGKTFAVFVIRNQAPLFVCKLTIAHSTRLRWDRIILSQSIKAEKELLVRRRKVYLWQKNDSNKKNLKGDNVSRGRNVFELIPSHGMKNKLLVIYTTTNVAEFSSQSNALDSAVLLHSVKKGKAEREAIQIITRNNRENVWILQQMGYLLNWCFVLFFSDSPQMPVCSQPYLFKTRGSVVLTQNTLKRYGIILFIPGSSSYFWVKLTRYVCVDEFSDILQRIIR